MQKSRRNGCWYGLSQMERSLFSLALRLRVKFESQALLKAIVSILKKLKGMSDEVYIQLMSGLRLAWEFSAAAVGWGNAGAKTWRNDTSYARYLGSHMISGGLRS